MMSISARHNYRWGVWLLWVGIAIVTILCGGPVRAQDNAVPTAGAGNTAAPRVFLPLLATAGSSLPVEDDAPPIILAEDGNVDGVWSTPRNDQGVTPVTCEYIDNTSGDITDENEVRYGQPLGAQDCGAPLFRSGFGFDGSNAVSFALNQPFLLGRFTHYNNNIVTPLVPMQLVDLTIGIQTLDPSVNAELTYTMRLDETTNAGDCPYGATNPGLCDDRVDFLNNSPGQVIYVNGAPYTLNILGFVPGTPESCQYSPTLADYFITGEIMQNDACVFAQFVSPQPAIAISKSPELQKIAAGDDANFEITVQNTGNVGLDVITVVDPLTPDCEREFGELKASATLTYACTAYGVEQDFENVATVSGVFSSTTYQANDSALVDVLAPDSATLFAYKYNDQNGDGQRGADEPGLSGWTLCVRDANGAAVGLCQTTDINGFAILAPNAAGNFQLCEVAQNGWSNTDPVDGSGCKPITMSQAPRYAELNPTVDDIYGIELTEKSSNQRNWTYTLYQFLGSQTLDAWVLALPGCIDAAQIDPAGTTPGWNLIVDNVTGLRGLRWSATVIPVEGTPFTVAFTQAHPTGATRGGVIIGGGSPIAASDAVAGPVCDPPVLLGNRASTTPTGTLEVRKAVLPATDAGRFNLLIDGQVFAANIQNGGTTGAQLVATGIHTIAESAGAQTMLDDYQRGLRCVETGSGSVWTPDASGRVNVNAGDNIVCTFTNIRLGAVAIVKHVTGAATAGWNFTGSLGDFTLPAAGGQQSFTRLAPGSYSVAEQPAAGWSLAALTCVDPGFDSQTSLTTGVATINLAPGETVTCTFANVQQAGSITVIKQVNGTATMPWNFTGTLGDFSLPATGGTRTFANLAPGAYTIRELGVENWRTSAITCIDPDAATTVDLTNATAAVDLDAREAVTCTFVNEPGTPAIALAKQASAATIYPGALVTYSFAVSNSGAVTLGNVRVDDPLCPTTPVLAGTVNIGDANGDGLLDLDETWRFTCSRALIKDTTNTATAYGDTPWSATVWAQASATVDVIAPALTVEKIADQSQVTPGTLVNYQITVRNSGDVPLFNVTVTDDQPACVPSGPTGDNGNAALDPGESWLYACAMTIVGDTVNTARATGYDTLGTRWEAADSAIVTVVQPAIDLVKTVNTAYAYPGEAVTFTVQVRNSGGVWLQNIAVADALPECQLTAPAGDDGDGRLAVGESWTYTCQIAFCADPHFALPSAATGLPLASGDFPTFCADVTNTATVTAEDPLGQPVSDSDSVTVDLIKPGLRVTKLADKTYVDPGELINFSIYVLNTGDTPLTDVVLTDSLPNCAVSGPAGDDGDGVLSPAEEWLYTCSTSVQVDTINTARGEAKDPRGTTWWDEDSVPITVCLE
jgi:uncharacterized repeat protein (TIGR01451 family)